MLVHSYRALAAAALAVALSASPALAQQPSTTPLPPPQPHSYPTTDEVAAEIYAQAKGLGLGDVAAAVAIGTALAESGLTVDTEGDCWYSDCSRGRTSSRGVFQQFYSWAPEGMAWSGTSYGPQTGGEGTDFSGFNESNAWGPYGWAEDDPRMDVVQAASMFLLGSGYDSYGGLEDVKKFKKMRTRPLSKVTDAQLATLAQAVQLFPMEHLDTYAQHMASARAYVRKLKSGKIDAPAFTMPWDEIAAFATTAPTKNAIAQHGG